MISYKSLIYRKHLFYRSINLIGLSIAISIFSCKATYKIIKFIFTTTCHLIKKFIRYIKFAKSEYSYTEVENIIKSMQPREFEKFLFNLFKELGYKVKLTPPSNDFGRDIVIYNDDNTTTFVEAKHWNIYGEQIGREICEKLLGAMNLLNADKGIIITTGKYHRNAKECARMVDNLELWNMKDIMYMVMKIKLERIPILMVKSLDNNTKILRLKPITY